MLLEMDQWGQNVAGILRTSPSLVNTEDEDCRAIKICEMRTVELSRYVRNVH